jgi:hypothetical protein
VWVVRGNGQSWTVSVGLGMVQDRTYALQIIQSVELGAQTTVYTQELLVHDRSQRQCAERVHACFIYSL